MKRLKLLLLAAAGALVLAIAAWPVRAEEKPTQIVGPVVRIEMESADANTATATLRVKGQKIPIVIEDEVTLNKFKAKKIRPGDEIRCSYKVIDGKNVSVSFKKTAGC